MFGFSRFSPGNFFSGFGGDNVNDNFERYNSNDSSNQFNSGSNFFINEYSCYPVSFAGRDELESGNKILLPPSALNMLARRNITWPMLFQVSNPLKNKFTHSGVLEFVAEEGTCYMPYWMMQNLMLQEGDIISVMNTSLNKGTYVKFMPLTVDFLDITNPKAVLETSLRNFATLTVGDIITISYNNSTYKISVLEAKPNNAISIIETDIQVDFAPPPNYVEPSYKSCDASSSSDCNNITSSNSCSFNYNKTMTESNIKTSVSSEYFSSSTESALFSGYGERLDGKPVKFNTSNSLSTIESEQTSNSDEPWKVNRLVGGVRTRNEKFQELVRSGKIPGIIGTVKK
ncbi:ubiquitin fusion degradation protein (UFD1) [Cryptosporidium ryanae]|uniref:ubiquitin fusion degradation protein (UFD1) n=1 Tax=Cryptosporidium ryanae TaxID=515981 RepID=UPI003519F4A1|nr:ubiquitin fusion degradation protein (UFD1) [Cryptosporidium ryanae]